MPQAVRLDWRLPNPRRRAQRRMRHRRATAQFGSVGHPAPHSLNRKACMENNTPTFAHGFDEPWVVGGIANHFLCSISCCLPRRPARLDAAGHLVSAASSKPSRCAPRAVAVVVREGCGVPDLHVKLQGGWDPFGPALQRWAELAFNSQVVHFPNGCSFSGIPEQTEDHQARVCQRHLLACQVEGCLSIVIYQKRVCLFCAQRDVIHSQCSRTDILSFDKSR